MNKIRIICIALMFIMALSGVSAKPLVQAAFYVSPNGIDGGDGSEERPFRTLEQAKEAVRKINNDMNGDIIVYLRQGMHFLERPLELDERDGGTNGFYIRYESYPGEEAVISGGKRVNGWKESLKGGGLWEAPLNDVEYVLNMDINGVPGRRARKETVGRILRPYSDPEDETYEINGFYTPADDLDKSYTRQKDIQLQVAYMWRTYIWNVDEIIPNPDNPAENLVKIATSYIDVFKDDIKGETGWGYWIHNVLEEMDIPGEFYYDRADGMLYYLPREGENMGEAEVHVSRLDKLVKIRGESSRNKACNIQFNSLKFMHATWFDQLRNGFTTGQTQDVWMQPENYLRTEEPGKFFIPAAVQLDYTDGIMFRDNTFRALGCVGIGMYQGVYNSKVIGNVFYDMGDSAVTVGMPNQAYESTVIDGYNLAEGKPATDSANPRVKHERYFTYFGPSAAVDPNKKTGWAAANVDLTEPWWQVDLLDEYRIDRIEIDARKGTDQAPTRRAFEIWASNDPDFNTYTLLGSQGSTPFEHEGTRIFPVKDNGTYRYVRIRKTVKEYFWLNEVRIINESMEFTPKWQLCRYNQIKNNYVTRVGDYDWAATGIHGYFVENLEIAHNEIYDLPYSGICSGWGWNNYLDMTACRDIRINYNKIHSVMQRCLDGGGIYTLGVQYNSTQIGNHTYDLPNPLGGFYTDTGTSYFTIRDNVIENTAFDFNTAGPTFSIGNLITNNYSNSMDGALVGLRGVALNGVTDTAINFVPGNYPEGAIDIVENAGIEDSWLHIKHKVPDAAFEKYDWEIFENMIHVTNYGSMNDSRFLNWNLKGPIAQTIKVVNLAEQEIKLGESVYPDEMIKEARACIEAAQAVALVQPVDRYAIMEQNTALREMLIKLGKSRIVLPYEKQLALAEEELSQATVGVAVGNCTQQAFDALKSSVEKAKEKYGKTTRPEELALSSLRIEKAYNSFMHNKVSLDIRGFDFGDNQIGSTVIDYDNCTVDIKLLYAAGTLLKPSIKLSDQTLVHPNVLQSMDFSAPVTYTVTTVDGTDSKNWTIRAAREDITSIEGLYALDDIIDDAFGWAAIGTRTLNYKNALYQDMTFDFNLSIESKQEGDWSSIVFRNQYYNREFNAKDNSSYIICISEGKVEFHRFNNGVRTQFYGPVAGTPQVYGDSIDLPEFKYGENNRIQLTTRNEEDGVRIILNINGKEVFNALDNLEGAITAPGYLGKIFPSVPVEINKVGM